jgi:hypothetical protein
MPEDADGGRERVSRETIGQKLKGSKLGPDRAQKLVKPSNP